MEEMKSNRISPVITVPDLAALLQIGRNAAYALVRSRAIRSVRIGMQYRIPREAIDEYLLRAKK